jgi:hypothetical protein
MIAFKIAKVDVPSDYQVRLLNAEDKGVELLLEADCCSTSYFTPESLADLKGLVGATLIELEEVQEKYWGHKYTNTDDTRTRYHALLIKTDKQSLTVDWRNDSNGYYDGNLDIRHIR